MSSTSLHEPADQLTARTIDVHRAVISLIEELEAVDWYNQRAEACKDEQLKAVLKHNRDEEWIRRNVPKFDQALKLFLFTSGEITAIEKVTNEGKKEEIATPERSSLRLTIGDMKGS
jgi:hypothetical protein